MMNQGGVSDTRTTLDQKVSLEVGLTLYCVGYYWVQWLGGKKRNY
ncbi:hypothetical protein HanPI659440_Chr06g0244481 [Helianthus annuus]|nr:hypothetical protein HanPI659440_Chr06g0244481 [Helianthus annuus]